MDPSTAAARAPGRPEPAFGGLVPPIFPATSYARDAGGSHPGGRSYARDQNPTGEPAEALLAGLEGGEAGILFASGMAAATALIDSLPDGASVVAPRHMYWTVRRWLEQEAVRGRLVLRSVDATDLDDWERALTEGQGTHQLVWVETPSNPMLEICDLAGVCERARAVGAMVVSDNTIATPVHTRPLEHGADVVFHSATKQLNGHGDVLAGALVTADPDHERWAAVRHQRAYRGAVLGPFEAWLLLRGMRTLYVRVPRSSATAAAVATAVADHPAVAQVIYPGRADHPGHAVAARQMTGGYGMVVSLRLTGGAAAARRVAANLELFCDATSLGSTESLVEHRRPVEGDASPVPDDLLRLAVGLEHPDDLIADLHRALDATEADLG